MEEKQKQIELNQWETRCAICLHVNYIGVVSMKVLEFRYEYVVHQFRVQYQ